MPCVLCPSCGHTIKGLNEKIQRLMVELGYTPQRILYNRHCTSKKNCRPLSLQIYGLVLGPLLHRPVRLLWSQLVCLVCSSVSLYLLAAAGWRC